MGEKAAKAEKTKAEKTSGRPRVRDVVAEGLYIAAAATRLALKNRILVESISDDENFDVDHYVAEARVIVLGLADEASAEAERVSRQLKDSWRRFDASSGTHEYRSRDARNLRRRRKQAQHTARELRERAADDEAMTRLVFAARDAAWGELAANIDRSLRATAARPDLDPDYDRMRTARMQALRLVDLPRLGAQRRLREPRAQASRPDSQAAPDVG